MERKNHVEDLLNELRSEKCYDAGRVAQESANTWSAAAREGRIYNKIFAAVPLVLIHIDDTYQRTENFSKAKGDHIAANFSEGAYEAVKLNYRDGAFYCPSGQHRVYAHIAMKREYIVAELSKMSWKEEVAVFLYQDDNRAKLTPYDRYKAGCAIGNKVDLALQRICNIYGVGIGRMARRGRLGSITTAREIISSQGEERFDLIMNTIVSAGWRDSLKAFDSRIVRALKSVYNDAADEQKARKVLIGFLSDTDPMTLYANSLTAYPHKEPASAIAELLKDVVSGRRAGKRAQMQVI